MPWPQKHLADRTILCFLLIACAGCGARFAAPIIGSGVVKTEQRAVAAFARIDAGSAVKLQWQPAKESSLEVTVDDNLLPHLITKLEGETLKVYFDVNVSPSREVVVKAAGPKLDGFSGSGASKSDLKDVGSDKFKLELSGAAICTIAGEAKALSVDCSGASVLKGDGFEAEAATVQASGAARAEVRAKGLSSLHQSGASNVTVTKVSADSVKLHLDGGSQCTVSGEVDKLSIEANGTAALRAAGLKAQSVRVDLSGASNVEIDAATKITGSAGGVARLHYQGKAVQEVQTSGSPSVVRK